MTPSVEVCIGATAFPVPVSIPPTTTYRVPDQATLFPPRNPDAPSPDQVAPVVETRTSFPATSEIATNRVPSQIASEQHALVPEGGVRVVHVIASGEVKNSLAPVTPTYCDPDHASLVTVTTGAACKVQVRPSGDVDVKFV